MLGRQGSSLSLAARIGALLCIGVTVLAITPAPAQAYTDDQIPGGTANPWMRFDKNPNAPLSSNLTAWVSINGGRYRISMRAGSGTGSQNDCATNQGWLPNGIYDPDTTDGDRFSHYYKTGGEPVVRGWVWYLGNKACSTGAVTRTALFIHSNGNENGGWSESNYASLGCIKINQVDRAYLHDRWSVAYNTAAGYLSVTS